MTRSFLILVLVLFFLVDTASGMPLEEIEGRSPDQAEMELLMRIARQARTSRYVDSILTIDGHPAIGSGDADIVLIEFSDFQCAFCRRHLNLVMPDLIREFIETGQVEYAFSDFPVEDRHPQAKQAAIAARCAHDQDKYWEMRQRLYISPAMLQETDLKEHAETAGLNTEEFDACLKSGRYEYAIRHDQSEGTKLRVRGTPTFFIGRRMPEGNRVRVEKSIIGHQPIDVFREHIYALAKGK